MMTYMSLRVGSSPLAAIDALIACSEFVAELKVVFKCLS